MADCLWRWFDNKFHPNGDNGHLGKEVHTNHASASSTQPALMAAPATQSGGATHSGGSDDLNDHLAHLQQDAPPCSECGTIMTRAGACYKCSNCGTTSGCG